VDVLVDMSTYGLSGQEFVQRVKSNMAVAGDPRAYGLGLLPAWLQPAQMTQNFDVLGSLGVVNLLTWPETEPSTLPQLYWDLCASFLRT
jgi:hypothetical protein